MFYPGIIFRLPISESPVAIKAFHLITEAWKVQIIESQLSYLFTASDNLKFGTTMKWNMTKQFMVIFIVSLKLRNAIKFDLILPLGNIATIMLQKLCKMSEFHRILTNIIKSWFCQILRLLLQGRRPIPEGSQSSFQGRVLGVDRPAVFDDPHQLLHVFFSGFHRQNGSTY